MTRIVNSRNQIWYERNNNIVTVGFTKDFLESMDQCWHILPANLNRLREQCPLMVVETNDSMVSIKSPITANFVLFNGKAQNFPNKLTEDDVVFEMRVGVEERPPARRPAAAAAPFNPQDFRGANGLIDWNMAAEAARAADPAAVRPRVAPTRPVIADDFQLDEAVEAAPAVRPGLVRGGRTF